MSKQKIKAIFKKFLFYGDPNQTKETVREMYDVLILSDEEITPEQRQRYTITCQNVEELMDDISALSKKILRKKNN